MSDAFYNGLQTTAHNLIKDKGKSVVIEQTGTTYPGYATEFNPVVGFLKSMDDFMESSMVQSKARRLILSAKGLGVVPKPGSTITLGSSTVSWRIKGVSPLKPGNVVVYYGLMVVK